MPEISTTEIQRLLLEACGTDAPAGERVKAVSLALAPPDYLQTVFEALDRERDQAADAVAVDAVIAEAERIAESFDISLRTLEVPKEFIALINDQLPLLQYLQERGILAPLAAGMAADGEIAGEGVTYDEEQAKSLPPASDTVTEFLDTFREAITNGQYRAAAIFFHGCEEDDEIHISQDLEEANILVIWLLHASGWELQAVMPYEMTREPGEEIVRCEYGDIRFGEMPAGLDDD